MIWFAKFLTRVVLVVVAVGLVAVSVSQIVALWPMDPDKPRNKNTSRVEVVGPGETFTFIDPRQAAENEPRRHVEIRTHFERIDFENETVTFAISAIVDRDWLDQASRDHPDALLLFRLFRLIPQSHEAQKSARELLHGTDEDEDFDLAWPIGEFTQKFDADASSFPFDQVFQFGQYSMHWMRSKNTGFPKDSTPVYLDWTYSVAPRLAGWVLEVTSTPHSRHAYRQMAKFSFKRDTNTITQTGLYLVALLCVTLAVAYFSLSHRRRDGSHLEEVGGIVALALAIPAIRSLLPSPGISISTLLDACFLFLFSIVIAAILVRIATQLR